MTESLLEGVIRPGTTRGLDFVNLDELRKRTGISAHEVCKWTINEMLCNALDSDATEMVVDVKTVGRFDEITVRDNGSKKISVKDIKLILDFSNKASSKRGILRVSRGSLGNALKSIFGYSYTLATTKNLPPQEIVITSHGKKYRIKLAPNRVKEVIEHEIAVDNDALVNYNSFRVKFPIDRSLSRVLGKTGDNPVIEASMIQDLIFATGMVNPTRRIKYDLWGIHQGSVGEAKGHQLHIKYTSVLWYKPQAFIELFYDCARVTTERLSRFLPCRS